MYASPNLEPVIAPCPVLTVASWPLLILMFYLQGWPLSCCPHLGHPVPRIQPGPSLLCLSSIPAGPSGHRAPRAESSLLQPSSLPVSISPQIQTHSHSCLHALLWVTKRLLKLHIFKPQFLLDTLLSPTCLLQPQLPHLGWWQAHPSSVAACRSEPEEHFRGLLIQRVPTLVHTHGTFLRTRVIQGFDLVKQDHHVHKHSLQSEPI